MFEIPVESSEPIARFIFDKKYIRSDSSIKHSAFMPWPRTGNISVYRVLDMTEFEVVNIGIDHVEPGRGKPIVGYGDLLAGSILEHGLSIEPTREPHPRHANVNDWPGGERDRLVAKLLAEESRFVPV